MASLGEGYTDSYNIVISPTEVVPPTPPPDEWPIVKPAQVFYNVRLSPGVNKEATKSKYKEVDTAVVLGARIDYTVKLEDSILTGCKAWILFNNEIMDRKEFFLWDPLGKVKSGSVLIPKEKILDTNTLTIILSHVPATFNSCLFNVDVMFGYSKEPSFDPPWTDILPDWTKYLIWAAIGGGLLVGVYAISKITKE